MINYSKIDKSRHTVNLSLPGSMGLLLGFTSILVTLGAPLAWKIDGWRQNGDARTLSCEESFMLFILSQIYRIFILN